MLPISKHHRFVIPHRLALVAAAVCLALSFTADRPGVDSQLQADRGEVSKRLETVDSDTGQTAPHHHGDQSRSGNPSLLPWFSGLMH